MLPNTTQILVVEDAMTVRKLVIMTLKKLGYTQIQEASDGNQAWELIQQASPCIELVISDWNMPHCSGLELLQKIRESSAHSKLPFVMLTAEAEAHQMEDIFSLGVSGYIVKPVNSETLSAQLIEVYKKLS